MSTKQVLIEELEAAVSGEPWHGPSLRDILKSVNFAMANSRPVPQVHSIAEIVMHLIAWTEEIADRLEGHPSSMPERGDWPSVDTLNEEDWNKILFDLSAAHQLLILNLQDFSDDNLQNIIGAERDTPLGSGLTYEVMLHGLAQHHAYHGGQIALLSKMLK
ncbi:DinB family protein [Solitalea lacus]|uniref:DinB family protein n=1 Tax=Solitalea lacus TaxID=2911172 RepID=UPI001EDC4DC5|nr:DinB family protein [Solitalea lacus]UKJ08434.1 DinB family protein [Solitalea lacus]